MSQTTRRSILKTLGVGGTVFAFGAGAGYAQTDSDSGSEDGAGEGVTLPPSDDTALLRALHASPDAPAVDVYVDGEQAAQGVEFGNISGYLELEPGEVTVAVYPSESGGEGTTTGAENETANESTGLGNETTETGAAAENETTNESEGLGNETTETGAAAENETTNESEGLGNETTNESEGLDNETEGLGNETETEMATGSSEQTPSGDPVLEESVTVQGGESYTVAAINQLDNIEALVLEDEPEDDQDQDEETDTALVRAVNLSPDAGTVKVRADSYVVGGALDYEEASTYGDLQTGNSQVEVLPSGSADPRGMANYEFEAGERYNLFLVGMVDTEPAAAQGGLEAATGTENESEVGAANESEGLGNETTNESTGLGNETTNESTGLGNETTNESEGLGNETTNESTGLGNETTNESEGLGNETTETGAAAENETTTETGAGGSEDQTQLESFRILGVQDSSGSVLEEAEEEETPSADDLLPVSLDDDNESDGNATAENETAENGTVANGTTENGTVANGTTENGTVANETAANGTATNGTVTEANNTSD